MLKDRKTRTKTFVPLLPTRWNESPPNSSPTHLRNNFLRSLRSLAATPIRVIRFIWCFLVPIRVSLPEPNQPLQPPLAPRLRHPHRLRVSKHLRVTTKSHQPGLESVGSQKPCFAAHRTTRGAISPFALIGNPGIGSYIRSKHGIVGLNRTAAVEYLRTAFGSMRSTRLERNADRP